MLPDAALGGLLKQAGMFDGSAPAVTQLFGHEGLLQRLLPSTEEFALASVTLREHERWRNALPRTSEILKEYATKHAFAGNGGIGSLLWAENLCWRSTSDRIASIVAEAQRAAELTQKMALPDMLSMYRPPIDLMTARLAGVLSVESLRDPSYLTAFTKMSALNELYAQSTQVSRTMLDAYGAIAADPIAVKSLAEYRGLLDAAGLTLPRWPRLRRRSHGEKQSRFSERLRAHTEPQHVRQAKSLVHQYELLLRDFLKASMTDAYGEDWAQERLPLCGCKDLVGKWKRHGGEVLDHADYFHYGRIVSDPVHFEEIFSICFEDADSANDLLSKAGQLRAASHHARAFTVEDLRDLRLVWRTIREGLVALDNYSIEY